MVLHWGWPVPNSWTCAGELPMTLAEVVRRWHGGGCLVGHSAQVGRSPPPPPKWMIWGYPYFWKRPYIYNINNLWLGRANSFEMCLFSRLCHTFTYFGLADEVMAQPIQKSGLPAHLFALFLIPWAEKLGFSPGDVKLMKDLNNLHRRAEKKCHPSNCFFEVSNGLSNSHRQG